MSNESKLAALAAKLRKDCQDQTGVDPALAYHDIWRTAALTVQEIEKTRETILLADREMRQLRTALDKANSKVDDLRSRMGSLGVDRDRGAREASKRAEAAYEIAEKALAAAGIDQGELADLVADQMEYSNRDWALVNGERERLEKFRLHVATLIKILRSLERLDGDGLTTDQVAKLCRTLDRANDKACGRQT